MTQANEKMNELKVSTKEKHEIANELLQQTKDKWKQKIEKANISPFFKKKDQNENPPTQNQ